MLGSTNFGQIVFLVKKEKKGYVNKKIIKKEGNKTDPNFVSHT